MLHETSSWAASRTNAIAKALRDMAVVAYRRCAIAPPAAVARAWTTLRRDARPSTIAGSRESGFFKGIFPSRQRGLERRTKDSADSAPVIIDGAQQLPTWCPEHAPTLTADQWDHLLADAVIPRVADAYPCARKQTPLIWHAPVAAAAELTGLLQTEDCQGRASFLDDLIGQGASSAALYHELIEPVARIISHLHDHDALNHFEVTLALARLQIEVRRLGPTADVESYRSPSRVKKSVLVAPQPGEPDGLGVAMASELFLQDGWDVTCEFPGNNAALCDILRDAWFDVLELSISPALQWKSVREAIRQTICAAHEASCNSSLIIAVYGQAFIDGRCAYAEVGADLSCITVVDVIPGVNRVLARRARREYS